MSASLVVELFTEELPPKALRDLGDAFATGIAEGLHARNLLEPGAAITPYATPRRLAVHITAVRTVAPDRPFTEKLMPVAVGLKDGKPTPALLKKLAAKNLAHVDPAALEREQDGKAEQLVHRGIAKGAPLAAGLQAALEETVAKLPIPKLMGYQLADGVTTVQFVRPAHGLLALHGRDVVPVTILGLTAGRVTHGHRFQGVKDIPVEAADAYADALAAHGRVVAAFGERRVQIRDALGAAAANLEAGLGDAAEVEALLDEVTALVEQPAVYAGEFDREFLAVPPECLALTMRAHQKYFPLFDGAGKLTNRFLIVSNMRLEDPGNVIEGNERVVRPRLADARFFFETDRKTPLAQRVPQLAGIVYHNRLGSQLDRVGRLRALARTIADALDADAELAGRAALLAKADLVTLMVGEFPELQGIMGRYYALADGEDARVADAIEAHYRPRHAGDTLPSQDIGVALALADKLDTLIGIWGIGQQPTGEKDPFGLRRAAMGVLRMLSEPGAAALDLAPLLAAAAGGYGEGVLAAGTAAQVHAFMLERLRSLLREQGFEANEIEAVLADQPTRIGRVRPRIAAVRAFRAVPEAASLAAANKRAKNILRKEGYTGVRPADGALFVEDAERALGRAIADIRTEVDAHYGRSEYLECLKTLARVKAPVDTFFDRVLVNAKDAKVRANRLALLSELADLMNRVADISRLAV